MQSGPYGHGRRGELGSGQIPAWEGHESKRRLGGNSEGSRAHLLVAWVGCGVACSGGATASSGPAREVSRDGGAPVNYGGGSRVEKLH